MGGVEHRARSLLAPARFAPAWPATGASRRRRPAALLLTLLAGCALASEDPGAPEDSRAAGDRAPAPAAPRTLVELPADWDEFDLESFEAWITALPADAAIALDGERFDELGRALAADELEAVRAALVLARCADSRAAEILLARLEQRVIAAQRHADAGDVVAAAALAAGAETEAQTARLAALAVGGEPHPDLEIRVECAASALARGRDDVVPFLLTVMRDATRAGRADPKDWPPQETLAWAKSRAARALHARLDRPNAFTPDASYAEQERVVAQLAEALRAAGVAVPASF